MASHNRHGDGSGPDARKLLQDRLQREEMGDEAYKRMIAQNGDSAFKKFGIVYIIAFGVIVLVASGLGW